MVKINHICSHELTVIVVEKIVINVSTGKEKVGEGFAPEQSKIASFFMCKSEK